jgi:hypothetical protein
VKTVNVYSRKIYRTIADAVAGEKPLLQGWVCEHAGAGPTAPKVDGAVVLCEDCGDPKLVQVQYCDEEVDCVVVPQEETRTGDEPISMISDLFDWKQQKECEFENRNEQGKYVRCGNAPFAIISVIHFVEYLNTGNGFCPSEPVEPWYLTVCPRHYQTWNMTIVHLIGDGTESAALNTAVYSPTGVA